MQYTRAVDPKHLGPYVEKKSKWAKRLKIALKLVVEFFLTFSKLSSRNPNLNTRNVVESIQNIPSRNFQACGIYLDKKRTNHSTY